MATLVLTTLGTAIGGPIGGALGAALGQSLDNRIFARGGRSGPRLADLRVQTSSYGTLIPRLYGTMRVAGTVIWSTDLIESRQRQSVAKGQPKATTYSYRASFAVALSSRRVTRIGRIWADGNLLRQADGQTTSRIVWRLHDGGADQAPDPLIVAAEGAGLAPAYRGIAYVVFEDLDLTPFGNRIPALTFEVVADEGDWPVDSLAAELLAVDAVAGAPDAPSLGGYAAPGITRADAAAPLLALTTLGRDEALALRVGHQAAIARPLPPIADDARRPTAQLSRAASQRLPVAVALGYFDPARDYQGGLQQAVVAGGAQGIDAVQLPASVTAATARRLVEQLARDLADAPLAAQWPVGFAGLALLPGMIVTAPGHAPRLIKDRRIAGAGVQLTLTPVPAAAGAAMAADGGRSLPAVDRHSGESVGAVFDLPALPALALSDAPGEAAITQAPRRMLAASGSGPGWRGAALSVVASTGAPEVDLGGVGAVQTLGTVTADHGPPGATAALFDRARSIDVTLLRADMTLTNADDADLLAGANMALIGDELVQFGHAQPLGGGVWRLTQLLRGRLGTAAWLASPLVGRAFVLADDPALLLLPGAAGLVPLSPASMLSLWGQGDAAPVPVPVHGDGAAALPLPAATLRWVPMADGGALLRWHRQSRFDFGWSDGADVPLTMLETRVQLIAGAVSQNADVTGGASELALAAASVAALRAGAPIVTVTLAQRVGLTESPAVSATFAL